MNNEYIKSEFVLFICNKIQREKEREKKLSLVFESTGKQVVRSYAPTCCIYVFMPFTHRDEHKPIA